MSSALATFFLPAGTVAGYGIYHGSSDTLHPFVTDTPDGAWEARLCATAASCACGQPAEPIIILSDYGSSSWWRGEWCPRCRCIIGPLGPNVCCVCLDNPFHGRRHKCVVPEIHEGVPSFPGASG
jgi:hypothetical protein